MTFSPGALLQAFVLAINAVAILSEDRFLAKIGWSSSLQNQANSYDSSGFGETGGPVLKARLINLISAVRTLMRIPLIAINILIILYTLLLG